MAAPVSPPKPRRTVTSLKLAVSRHSILAVGTKQSQHASARFEQFLADIVHRKIGELPSPACRVVLCAMAFDALGREDQLPLYLRALGELRTWGARQYATWERAGQIHRRVPSVFTLLAIRDVDLESVDWPQVLAQVERFLASCYGFARPVPIGRRIQAVLEDGLAFLEHRLPRPLFAHVADVLRWTALPSSAWERRHGATAVKEQEKGNATEDADLSAVSDAIVETLYEGDAPVSGSWFAQLLYGVCDGLVGSGVKRSNRRIHRELVRRLHNLSGQLGEVGPIEAVLLGWALDIVSFGSARLSDPTVKTLSNYLKAAVTPLHRALSQRDQHPLGLTSEDWDEVFRKLLKEQTNSLLRPALSSFQRYMVRAHDAAPLPWLFCAPADVRTPRANVLWPHEFDGLPSALTHLLQDERAVLQTQVWVALLRATSLRFGELIRLELNSIAFPDDGSMRIALASARGQPGLKSEAARRVMEIFDPTAVAAVRSWTDRRTKEACAGDELLFGDPYRPKKIYRLGACYGALALAMKQVTGDDEIVVHATRHTFASMNVQGALLEAMTEFKEIRRLQALRVQMGHADFLTTLATYCHVYEDVLRDCVDVLIQHVPVRIQDAAAWTLDGDATLEQRAARFRQRGRRDLAWSPWTELLDCTRPALAIRYTAAAAQPAAPAPPKSLSLRCVHHIAGDWAAGVELDRIQSRSGHDGAIVQAVVTQLEKACMQVCLARRARKAVNDGWSDWLKGETNLRRLGDPRWASAMNSLEKVVTEAQSLRVERWLHASAGLGIDGSHAALADVLRFLSDAGFGVEWFVVRASDAEKVKAVSDVFVDVFAARAQAELVTARRGKPAAYVQVLTKPVRGDVSVPAATSDMKTLRALLLLGVTYQQSLFKSKEAS